MTTTVEPSPPQNESTILPTRLPNTAIAAVYIENFRCFGSGRWIELANENGTVPRRVVLHGKSGSGKSTFLSAIALFVEVALKIIQDNFHSLVWGKEKLIAKIARDDTDSISWGGAWATYGRRDRPQNPVGETRIALRFEDSLLRPLELRIVPTGGSTEFRLAGLGGELAGLGGEVVTEANIISWMVALQWGLAKEDPRFAILDSTRRMGANAYYGSVIADNIIQKLHERSTSLNPDVRAAWRRFKSMLAEFELFRGRSAQIEVRPNHNPQLIFEDAASVLDSRELSSGEQHIVSQLAHFVVVPARLRAIQEPELGLDIDLQHALSRSFDRWLHETPGAQLFIESHSVAFDSAEVLRFERTGTHEVVVTRSKPAASSENLRVKAEAIGGSTAWVTPEGYTRLPKAMIDDLQLQAGGGLWFVKGDERWEGWLDDDLQSAIGGKPER